MALEALTYERLRAYKDFLPIDQCEAWQPRQVLRALLEIDPHADKGATIFIGLEETYGVPAKKMSLLGTEHVVDLQTIKKHYDALGSYLHLPTLKQLREGSAPDESKLRKHCDAAAFAIEKALSSNLMNAVIGIPVNFPCQRCAEPIARKMPMPPFEFNSKCSHCGAEYHFEGDNDGVRHRARCTEHRCPTDACEGTRHFWPDELKPGTQWTCERCGDTYLLVLGVQALEEKLDGQTAASNSERAQMSS
jgi:hypothetical protein